MRLSALKFLIAASGFLTPSFSFGHARLSVPVPRSNNAGIKAGPCGNLARSANPVVWTVGQTVTVNWEETINHPGKFLFSISPANDADFVLAKMVVDDKDGGVAFPHLYTTTLTVPNTPCEACTFQMIQSMEENPNSPTFYYSCADIKIVAANGSPPPGGDSGENSSQSSTGGSAANQPTAQMGGCGLIGSLPPGQGPGVAPMIATFAFMLLSLMTYARAILSVGKNSSNGALASVENISEIFHC